MGNLKEATFEEIMHSREAEEAMKKVQKCKRDCCFIVTERHDMVRRPWKPIYWIAKNKLKLAFNLPTDFE